MSEEHAVRRYMHLLVFHQELVTDTSDCTPNRFWRYRRPVIHLDCSGSLVSPFKVDVVGLEHFSGLSVKV